MSVTWPLLAATWPRTYAAGFTGTLAKSADPSSVYAKAASFAARWPATTGTIRYSALLLSPNPSCGPSHYSAPMSHPIPASIRKGCLAVNPSDIAIALLALDARIVTTKRSLPAELFFKATAMSSTVLQAEELIKEIQIPKPPAGARQRYEKFTLRKPVDFAVVSVASVLTLDNGVCKDARIVLGAVAPEPVRARNAEEAIKGRILDEDDCGGSG